MNSYLHFPSQAPKKSAEPIFGSVTERVNKHRLRHSVIGVPRVNTALMQSDRVHQKDNYVQ